MLCVVGGMLWSFLSCCVCRIFSIMLCLSYLVLGLFYFALSGLSFVFSLLFSLVFSLLYCGLSFLLSLVLCIGICIKAKGKGQG